MKYKMKGITHNLNPELTKVVDIFKGNLHLQRNLRIWQKSLPMSFNLKQKYIINTSQCVLN